MPKYQINHEKNGIEIYFESKPNVIIRDELKELGFRWHSAGKYWYAKRSKATESLAKRICTGKKKIQPTPIIKNECRIGPEYVEDARRHWENERLRKRKAASSYGWLTRSLISRGEYNPEGFGYRGGSCSSK